MRSTPHPATPGWPGSPWRRALWATATILLLAPAIAMLFTSEMNWGPGDFLAAALLLGATAGTVDLAARTSAHWSYRAGAAVAAGTALLLVWINLAVGLIGAEDNPANLLFAAPLAVAIGGTLKTRASARGLAWTMLATTLAQVAVGLVAHAMGAAVILPATAAFAALWLAAALLFERGARA